MFGVRACSLRLTNVYGPRQLLKHNRQGFIAWFIRLAIEDREIQIYGDGSQLRDFVYVDDAADAFLRAGADEACNGQVLNVGGLEPIAHRDLAQLLVGIAGSGRYRFVEWPPEKKAIDIGDFYADSTRIGRTLGWKPDITLADGLRRTIDFYRQHFDAYVPASPAARRCDHSSERSVPRSSPPRGAAACRTIARVTARGWFVLGPEVEAFESEFAAASGASSAVGTATGRMRSRCCCARPGRRGRRSDRAGRHGRVTPRSP